MSALTGGGGAIGPITFEYLGSFEFFSGTGWQQIGNISPFHTGIIISDPSKYFAVIAIPTQTDATPSNQRSGDNIWTRTANWCSRSGAYCTGWNDTTMREYIDESNELILDSINWSFAWKGPYHVYGIRL